MSHNKIKVGGKTPDSAGEISVALNDLSDVSGSPSTGEALVYGGAGWAPAVGGGDLQAIFIAHRSGVAPAYSASPASAMTTNSTFYVYDSAPYNTITGSTINQTNGWVDYITLPAGKYTIQSQVRAEFSASTGYLGTVWKNSANNVQYSAEGFVGDLSSFGGPTAEALGHLDISVNTDIYLKIGQVSSIHAIASQSTTPAEYSAVVILKLE
tara:strand:- start:69 stop:701 length:633 start_codon:yes stop_codon:yes gene_type:complete